MGDTPLGSSARLSGDFERSYERERERLEGMLSTSSTWVTRTATLLTVIEHGPSGVGICHYCANGVGPLDEMLRARKTYKIL